jgi:hypothetical protein
MTTSVRVGNTELFNAQNTLPAASQVVRSRTSHPANAQDNGIVNSLHLSLVVTKRKKELVGEILDKLVNSRTSGTSPQSSPRFSSCNIVCMNNTFIPDRTPADEHARARD